MDADSDNDTDVQVGRRHSSPIRRRGRVSPCSKRQRRSFTPTSDDGDLVVPVVHNQDSDTETRTPENAPLIRQAVGFSSVGANVSTYQATVAPRPVVPYFLPGQAPPPPKPKSSKPRAPRRKRDQQYSGQTTKFKISGTTSSPPSGPATSTGNSPDINSPTGATCPTAVSPPTMPATNYAFSYANENPASGPSPIDGATTSAASDPLPLGTKRPRKPSKRKAPTLVDDSFGQSSVRPSPRPPSPGSTPAASQCPVNATPGGLHVERPGQAPHQSTYSASSRGGAPAAHTNAPTAATQSLAQNVSRPMRMITLLIEDMRSSVPDPQLAEVRVPLKVADDPEDGFWADAAEICHALQSGPSRIDGPAKVYTMRGRFRQFFMRIDQFDQLQVQSAHLIISKDRTLSVYVEAPVPQGQLPRPPAPPLDARPSYNTSAGREATTSRAEMGYRSTYSLATREDQIERLSRSSYARPQSRFSPISESGSYGHSQRTTSPSRPSRYEQYAGPSQHPLTPPIPGRLADTQEEKDEAIANYIRSHIENHSGWMDYMQSKAKPQRVSEVLKQYAFVESRVSELIGLKTPSHWDGAPNCYVEKHHIWRVLKLDSKWGEECQEVSLLVGFYGENGSRYEDSRVVDMINDTSVPRVNTMEKFLRFLRSVDETFAEDALRGRFAPMSTED